jgi:type IV pilus assembly protein PilX
MKTPAYPRLQRGAALIVAMILLMIMSLLTVTSLRTGIQEERMSGAAYDRNLAFQGAGAALRAGERKAEDWIQTYTTGSGMLPSDSSCGAGTADNADGIYPETDPDCTPRWEGTTAWHQLNSADVVTDTDFKANVLSLAPSYIIELITIEAPCDPMQPDAGTNLCVRLRVTAKSSADGGRSKSVLQSIYATSLPSSSPP